MGSYEPIKINKGKPRGRIFDKIWNVLTIIIVMAMLIMAAFIVYLYFYPNTAYNPFPLPTLPAKIELTTAEPDKPVQNIVIPMDTPTVFISTNTPGNIVETLTGTKFVVTPTVTRDLDQSYPFVAQSNPTGIDATILYPDRDCNWMGVGGQISDMQGRPYREIIVRMAGVLDGNTVNLTSLAGTAIKYGEAGFEFTLADKPIGSEGDLWLWLVDQEEIPLSERVYFDTYTACDKNLIIINFKQVR